MPSLSRQVHEELEALEGPDRYLDLCLALVAQTTQETILLAGGRWDRIDRRYLDRGAEERVQVIELAPSQVPFAQWYADQLGDMRDGYPRDVSLVLAAGDRRGGKTFDALACLWASLVDLPAINGWPTTTWAISRSFREREEIDQWVAKFIPRSWYSQLKAPEHRYTLQNGAILRNLSADDPDNLKQGRVDLCFYNEPQKMAAKAIVHGLFGTSDAAGLAILAANPPPAGDSRGEWLYDLKDAIDDEIRTQATALGREPLGAVYFNFSSKGNPYIDAPARRRVGRLARLIDPAQGEADDAGEWKRPGDKALWEFSKHEHLQAVPAIGVVSCMKAIARIHAFGDWTQAAGVDFQSKPHIVAEILDAFGDPDHPIFWSLGELVLPRCTEAEFLEAFADKFGTRYEKNGLLWIGDASGAFQGSKHQAAEGERPSFETWQQAGWQIIPPKPPRPGGSGKARNPFVDERLQLANELLRLKRWFIDPTACPWLAECAREAATKRLAGRRHLVGNQFAHAIDAATYPLWRLEPKPGDKLNAGDFKPVSFVRPGSNYYR